MSVPGQEYLGHQLLSRLRLKHLRLIEALERLGSLRRAAQELNCSQPAATKILQDLEDTVGVHLFHRTARKLQINDFGMAVAGFARRMLGETQRFGIDLATHVQTGYARISVGAIMIAAGQLLPAAVLALKQTRPGAVVRLVESSSDRLLMGLANNEYDFAIGRFTDPQDAVLFDFIPLNEERLCIFTASDTPIDPNARTLKDLHPMQWVIQDSPTPTRRLLEEAFAQERLFLPANAVQTSSVYAMLHLVEQAGLIGVLPRLMVKQAGDKFRILPIELPIQLSPYGIILQRNMEPSPAAREFISILVNLAKQGVGAG